MKAVYLEKAQLFVEKDIAAPVCGDEEVLVDIKAVGICGSDVHYWKNGRIGSFVVEAPMILGHECAGIVTAVGKNVTKFQVGDKVALEPGIPCMKCDLCKHGRYNMCQNIVFFATPPDDGVMKEAIAYPEEYTFKLPEGMEDFGLGTMAEPMSVGVFATQRIQPQLGEKCIIFGAGIIGLMCMLAARAAGCDYIAVADIRDDRLEWAKMLGADEVINTLKETIPNDKFDFGYEASGAEPCYNIAVKCVKPGGRVSFLGMGKEIQSFNFVDYICREISIIPSFRYGNTYPIALDLVAKNQEKLQKLITHRLDFTLDNVEKGFHIALEDPTAVKVMIEMK